MRVIPIALAANFARQGENTPEWTVFLKITRSDNLVVAGTSFPRDLDYDGVRYYARSGGTVADMQTSATLAVSNSEFRANFDLITDEDIQAKLWNGAAYELFIADYTQLVGSPITAVRYVISAGNLGQFTNDILGFVAELFGRMVSLQNQFGDLIGPCTYDLGDANCRRSLTDLTVTGTADSVSADGLTWTDAARTEPGPAGGVNIVSIARGTTTTITTDAPLGVPDGGTVTLSAMDGMELLGGVHTVRNPSGNAFDILVDTTDTGVYSDFVSGTATPMGAESGYFDFGRMTILDVGSPSSRNAGITREVKSYVEGEWTLQDAFPFPVTGAEDYRLVAGCDKLDTTCRVKFGNLVNYGGESKVQGNDLMVQVGRQE